MEEEVGGIQSQAKDHKEPPEAIRGTGGVSSRTFGRSMWESNQSLVYLFFSFLMSQAE